MGYEYHLECRNAEKWIRFKSHLSLQYAKGWIDSRKEMSPRPSIRLVRSDGRIVDEISEINEVLVGQVAGFPTAEQYEQAASLALKRAKAIREANTRNNHK